MVSGTGTDQDLHDTVTEEAAAKEKAEAVAAGVNAKEAAPKAPDTAEVDGREIPRWRQIEILKERQELKELLDDYGDEDLEIDDEVFGFEEDSEGYFRTSDNDEIDVQEPGDGEILMDDFDEED